MQLTATLALFSALLPFAIADCCGAEGTFPPFDPGKCGDGTMPTPCCAYGGCNIFCCNCDGGCRSSINRFTLSRLAKQPSDAQVFENAKGFHAGEMTLRQYTSYMGVSAHDPVYVDWFNKHDKNGDGVITFDEIRLEGEEEL